MLINLCKINQITKHQQNNVEQAPKAEVKEYFEAFETFLKEFIQQISKSEHNDLTTKGYFYSVVDELKKQYYNDSFQRLKDHLKGFKSLDDVRKSKETEDRISKFNKTEIEYLLSNTRFIYILGNDLMNRITSKKQGKL